MPVLTHCLAHSSSKIHLIATATLTFVAPFQVDTDLTTDTRVLAFINICKDNNLICSHLHNISRVYINLLDTCLHRFSCL